MTSAQLPIAISIIGALVAAISLLVSSISALTSFRALRHSRRTSYTQLRPWVCYEETGIDVFTDASGQPHLAFHVKWKNAGSTPARIGEVIALGRAFPTEELARAYTFERIEADPNISGLIGPGITLNSPTGMFRLQDFRSGSTVFYSKVTYQDILSEGTHESEVKVLISSPGTSGRGITFLYQIISANAT